MENKSTPEDKLLNLIRNKGNIKASAIFKVAEKCRPIFLRNKFFHNIFSFKKLNIALSVIIVIFLGIIVFELFFSEEGRIQDLKTAQNTEDKPIMKETPLPEMPSFDYYADKLKQRDIFKPAFGQDQSQGPGAGAVVDEQVANLRLAGIILDKEPQAIIEDTKLKKTYFLNKGGLIGEIKVEDIQESKVILSYGEKSFELVP